MAARTPILTLTTEEYSTEPRTSFERFFLAIRVRVSSHKRDKYFNRCSLNLTQTSFFAINRANSLEGLLSTLALYYYQTLGDLSILELYSLSGFDHPICWNG